LDYSEYTPNRIPLYASEVLPWKGHVVKVVLKPNVIQVKGRVVSITGHKVCVEINGQRRDVLADEIRLPAKMKKPPRRKVHTHKKGKKGLMMRIRTGIRWFMLLLG
jgi:hypothetical protein